MKKIIIPIAALALFGNSFNAKAQSPASALPAGSKAVQTAGNVSVAPTEETPVDGYFNTTAFENATPFNYANVDKNSIRLYKRVWRDIELNDPKNQIFATPGASLIEILLEGVKTGKIAAYDPIPSAQDPNGDGFKTKMTYNQFMDKLTDSVLVPKFDANGNQISAEMMRNDFSPEKITKFRIKEDIFYDKQRSKTETRIVGIAPLIDVQIDGQSLGSSVVGWFYFPQARSVFAKVDVSDPDRKMFDMSMDDLFVQRKFNGMIVKESNALGQVIKDYTHDADREKLSMLAEQKLKAYKTKIWEYNTADKAKTDTKVVKAKEAPAKTTVVKETIPTETSTKQTIAKAQE